RSYEVDEEYARKLEAKEQEATRLSKAQQNKEANNSWDNMQSMMDADRLLAKRLQAREREEFYEMQKARLLVELIEKRKKHFAALRAQEKRNKPPTKTQMKSQMSTYLKHIGRYKQSHLKERSFDEIKKLFDREMRKVNDFIAMDLETQKSSSKEAQESSTKRTTKHLESDISKKQKVDENVKPVIDDSKELKKCMEIVLDDGDEIVQICLWVIDSGCSKHMTGNHALLTNFMEKFLGMVRFGNNDFVVIVVYGDLVIGSMTIKKVYYVEGLGDNLFSVGQFCHKGLEVAFRKSLCFVQTEDGVDLLTGDCSSNLYSIALNDIALNYSACLLAKASSRQSLLWHQRKSSNSTVSQVSKTLKKDLEDLFHNFYDGYFDDSKITKSLTTNAETSNDEIPSYQEVFHESSESFQEESSSFSLNDDVQPTKDHPLYKIIGDPKSSVRTRGQLANSCLFACLLSNIEPANIAEALKDTDWVGAMQEELDQFARLKVWRLVP
nr:integrase, catalytic region, zinc finger, CCHC-type, peptidase aspartic, catalytic [Tanacetum cinerariifolium]